MFVKNVCSLHSPITEAGNSSPAKGFNSWQRRTAPPKLRRSARLPKRNAAAKAAAPEKSQVQTVAQTAVDVPVGIVLNVSDRLTELVEPFTGRSSAEKQVKAYRTQVRRSLKRAERRGATARRKAATEAKRNRRATEQRVRKAIEEQTSRAQDLVDRATEQLSALR